MKEFNINVHVRRGVTEQLYALVAAFAGGQGRVPATQAQAPEPTPEPAQAEMPAEAAEQQPAPAAAPAPESAKEYTEADVRAAMDRARRRIEGEDYKENTAGEGYQKYHRQLTGEFKRIASLLGADKPSALPDSAARATFISRCDELVIKGGELTTESPFLRWERTHC